MMDVGWSLVFRFVRRRLFYLHGLDGFDLRFCFQAIDNGLKFLGHFGQLGDDVFCFHSPDTHFIGFAFWRRIIRAGNLPEQSNAAGREGSGHRRVPNIVPALRRVDAVG
jgi:hypothetical protein